MIFSLQKDKERRSSLTSLFQVRFKDALPYLVNTWVAPYALILRLFFTSTMKKTAPAPTEVLIWYLSTTNIHRITSEHTNAR